MHFAGRAVSAEVASSGCSVRAQRTLPTPPPSTSGRTWRGRCRAPAPPRCDCRRETRAPAAAAVGGPRVAYARWRRAAAPRRRAGAPGKLGAARSARPRRPAAPAATSRITLSSWRTLPGHSPACSTRPRRPRAQAFGARGGRGSARRGARCRPAARAAAGSRIRTTWSRRSRSSRNRPSRTSSSSGRLRGGDDADVHPARRRLASALDHAGLQQPEEPRLGRERHRAHPAEKQRAAVRQLGPADRRRCRGRPGAAWPNSSASRSDGATAPQSTTMSGRSARRLRAWIAWATSSLPVPGSPSITTGASLGAIGLDQVVERRHRRVGADQTAVAGPSAGAGAVAAEHRQVADEDQDAGPSGGVGPGMGEGLRRCGGCPGRRARWRGRWWAGRRSGRPEQIADGGVEMEDFTPGTAMRGGGSEAGDPAGRGIVQHDPSLGVDGHHAVVGRGEPGLEDPRVHRFHGAGSRGEECLAQYERTPSRRKQRRSARCIDRSFYCLTTRNFIG